MLRIIPNNLNEWMLIGKECFRERDSRAKEAQSLSQQKLALMIGSSKSHIWRIESGRVSVGLDDLGRIADALDVQVRDLFSF